MFAGEVDRDPISSGYAHNQQTCNAGLRLYQKPLACSVINRLYRLRTGPNGQSIKSICAKWLTGLPLPYSSLLAPRLTHGTVIKPWEYRAKSELQRVV